VSDDADDAVNRGSRPDAAEGSPPADPAHRLLARARRAKPVRRTSTRTPGEAKWSGAGPDPRDPTLLSNAVEDLVKDRSWQQTLNKAGLLPRWAEIVGAEVAAHCRPERLTDGELVCVAESTAWATQLRLLNRQLLARIAAEVGDGVVTRIRVHGPTAPDWRHGPLRVVGRGPRDTYG
jgi:predicted nucleic acid-binding Zn ribbon protein